MPTRIAPLGNRDLPPALPLKKLLGPSFILLGLGLGSGELVLWPYMASKYGLGVVWGMFVGISMQFFINMEVSRYALVNGESVFVGFARLSRRLPPWFIVSTFLGFGWPGIGLYGASLLGEALKPLVEIPTHFIAVIVFVFIALVLTLGKVLYRTVERLQKILIGICVPLIVFLAYYIATRAQIGDMFRGLVGQGQVNGESYLFLPKGILLGTFLGALAYSGAGGNLNLTQSCYVRDKGYGMGAYADKITSLFTTKGATGRFQITGNTFPLDEKNLKRFADWWRVINLEHLLIFWGLGLFTMLSLSLLSYATTFQVQNAAQGIDFLVFEAQQIAHATAPFVSTLFLLVAGVMLCATQLTVLDSTSRIISENVLLIKNSSESTQVSALYYKVLWTQILFGISVFLFGFDQPIKLIVLGAVINAFSMLVYTVIILRLNNVALAKQLRPARWRSLILIFTILFFSFFCALSAYFEFMKP